MRVLQSFQTRPGATSPYLVQLGSHLSPETEVLGFSWCRALTTPYDVFHVHRPDSLLHGSSSARRLVSRFLFRTLLLRLSLRRRTAVVRTLHDAHDQRTARRTDRELLARLDRRTTLWIRLTPAAPVPAEVHGAMHTIGHGDYNEWFGTITDESARPGALLYFGTIRPRKGIPGLVEAFTALPTGPDGGALSLRVAGTPTSSDLGAEVLLAALADDRVTVSLGHHTDGELAGEVARAELVILPYPHLHGSEASVLALSMGRPILVPSNPATAALSAEVGPGWVYTYTGELNAAVLRDALARSRAAQPHRGARPNLSARTWPHIAAEHRAAYRAALHLVRRRTRLSGPGPDLDGPDAGNR